MKLIQCTFEFELKLKLEVNYHHVTLKCQAARTQKCFLLGCFSQVASCTYRGRAIQEWMPKDELICLISSSLLLLK